MSRAPLRLPWRQRLLFACLALGLLLAGRASSGQEALSSAPEVEFNRQIRPILSDRCFQCHGPDPSHRKADLRLDLREAALAELSGGYAAILPGEPDESELLYRIETDDEFDRMPPEGHGEPLSPEQVDMFRRWIEQGAEYQEHWAYQVPKRPALPRVENQDWPQGAIDHFILTRIEAEGLSPAPEADRTTLIRRLSFDLLGLPPTPEAVSSFLEDDRPDAYERLVDTLLASPRFGERLAMYWLDLVRYADTVGYHGDQEHHISPYRDWVISAFNSNMPFDQFTTEQLAGDLLPEADVDQLIASGYNRVLQTTHEGGAQDKEYRAKYAADRVRNVSNVWMGATMGCAECHDHKFDPYSQADFYSMAAFFADIEERGAFPGPDRTPTVRAPEMDVLPAYDRAEMARILADLKERTQELEQLESEPEPEAEAEDCAPRRVEVQNQIARLEARKEQLEKNQRRTMITRSVEPREMRVLPRGDWMDDSGPIVEPAVPEALGSLKVEDRRANRLDLARWLTSGEHPQTARVFVNRLWYLYFGEGLSRTLEDNGSQGALPSHPELLDWLAFEFAEEGWDVKHLIRLIVTSKTYKQSSIVPDELQKRDPENQLFARQGRPRLPAEMIRDNALAISGLLVEKSGGMPARPYQPAGYYSYLNFPKREYVSDTDENQYRRGVYMHWQRQFLHPMLRAFDASTREECTAERPVSNTPLAALVLLNDPTFVEAARGFATRILQEVDSNDDEERIRWAWQAALAREPIDQELAALSEHLQESRAHYEADPEAAAQLIGIGLSNAPETIEPTELAAWTSLTRAILNLNETITRN